mgnify:CR=1 FL=1
MSYLSIRVMIRNISGYFAGSRLNITAAEFMKIKGEIIFGAQKNEKNRLRRADNRLRRARAPHLSEAYLFWGPIRSGVWIFCQPPGGLTLSQIPPAPALTLETCFLVLDVTC